MDESQFSKSGNAQSLINVNDVNNVYWHPNEFSLKGFIDKRDEKTRKAIENIVTQNPISGSVNGDIFLIAHPGPVLMGAMSLQDDQYVFVPTDTTVNWVSFGLDHRLSNIWATWQNGAPLSRTQIKAIADTCDRLESHRIAQILTPLGDDTEPDEVSEYSGHESGIVTLRTARARAVAQNRTTVTIPDVVLGLLSSTHRDTVSLALRNLAAPKALQALDNAKWSTDVTPGPGCQVDSAVRDLLGSTMSNESLGMRNASILAALLRNGFDQQYGTLATLFQEPKSLEPISLEDFANNVIAQRKQFAENGTTSDLIQINYFEEIFTEMRNDSAFSATSSLGSAIPLESLFPDTDSKSSGPNQDTLLIPATRVDVPSGEDKLGIEDEAAAFARLIAFKKSSLPLSIGIFGHWGSGKTFFLNTVRRKIEELKGEDYHQNIVVVEFNAWHYMESNIWASLVSVIFKELLVAQKGEEKKASSVEMLDALAASQDAQFDAIEELINRYRAANEAEKEYTKAVSAVQRDKSKSIKYARSILEQLEKERKTELATLEAALADDVRFCTVGEKKIHIAQSDSIEREKNIFALLDAVRDLISSGQLLRSKMRKVFCSPWLLLPMATALMAVPFGISLLLEFMGHNDFLGFEFAPVIATLVGGVGIAAARVRSITQTVTTAFAKIENDVDNNSDLAEYHAARAAEVLNVEAARKRLEKRTKEANEARESLNANTLLGRLSQLIQTRAEGDTYTKHLSIIATIRADFEDLSNMLAKTDERELEANQLSKIQTNAVKRLEQLKDNIMKTNNECESDKAGEKRQQDEPIATDSNATEAFEKSTEQLAEAFGNSEYGKLAVTMIEDTEKRIKAYKPTNAIDRVVLMIDDLDRCPPDKVYDVLQAVHLFLSFPLFAAMVGVDTRWMETSLKTQLGELVSGENGATPRDYLEKIFQIPYWSKALQPAQAQAFVGNILKDIDVRVAPVKPDLPSDVNNNNDGDNSVSGKGPKQPKNDEQVNPPEPESQKPPPKVSVFAVPTKEEAAFLTSVSGFAGTTPRRVIRFLNIFLLIKTLPYGQRDIEHQRAIITQLAFCVGIPEHAGAYFDELKTECADETIAQFCDRLLERLKRENAKDEVQDRIQKLLEIYSQSTSSDALGKLRLTADAARKFTFASPEAAELETAGDGGSN